MLFTSIKIESKPEKSKALFGALASAMLGAGLFLAIIQPGDIHTDGGIFSAVAYKQLHGGVLYLDAWENKPPGIFVLIELFMLCIPNPVYAVFTLALLAFMSISAVLFLITYYNFKSLLLSLSLIPISIYFSVYRNNIGDGLYTEIYGSLSVLLSILFYVLYRENPNKRNMLLSLMFSTLGCWFKEPFFIICLPLTIFLIYTYWGKIKTYQLFLFPLIPTMFFLLYVGVFGSLEGLLKTLLYNFSFAESESKFTMGFRLQEIYKRLFDYILPQLIFSMIILFRNDQLKKNISQLLMLLFLFLGAFIFALISPYEFGHYYYPLFSITFAILPMLYGICEGDKKGYKWLLIIINLYAMNQMDNELKPEFMFKIEPYKEDKWSSFLKSQKDKTLFIDYIPKVDYYVKAEKIHPAYMPVGVSVHFNKDSTGKANTLKMWESLNGQKPDYLITTYTTSSFTWSFPDTKFYENNYSKIDSLQKENELILYLWKKKSN
ncbi:MAG TPA: hypothetical protein VGF79_09525 [Bacteroidia bacterium]